MCQADLDAGRLKRVLPRLWLESIGVYVALPPGLHRPARVTAFIDALRLRIKDMRGFQSYS
jgi:DNA-binding transcriptional LysR family regulator